MGSRPFHSTGRRAGLRRTRSIQPRMIRGCLFYQTADVLFPTFVRAACAWAAAEAYRLALLDTGGTL